VACISFAWKISGQMMLNFAEQTISGAGIIVWSILMLQASHYYIAKQLIFSFFFLQLSRLANGPLQHAFITSSASPACEEMERSRSATMPLENAFQIVLVKKANLEYAVSRDLSWIKLARGG